MSFSCSSHECFESRSPVPLLSIDFHKHNCPGRLEKLLSDHREKKADPVDLDVSPVMGLRSERSDGSTCEYLVFFAVPLWQAARTSSGGAGRSYGLLEARQKIGKTLCRDHAYTPDVPLSPNADRFNLAFSHQLVELRPRHPAVRNCSWDPKIFWL
jgi:hypothetical protein